ncbi:unnamed protein product [Brachionus calyciflorus]|uniref:Protein kinase domain-containing protein n=1 Tax=Brachionus calyciflorus TaxID=104777 RepID=A0A814HL33_9BILA|nr:unnamed protein product [Brachionus calyciflorus]
MGNIDTKLSSYYSIIDEKTDSPSISKTSEINLNDLKKFTSNISIWSIKKVKYSSENKNSLLFEYDLSKPDYQKHLKLALNQIKYIKTLRHPNIVKYFYSQEPPNSKCLLITESLRPLNSLIDDLSKEQIIRGLYGISNAILFLHEKVNVSHNNLSVISINLNAKQTWKLNNFELSLPFTDLNKNNLKLIYEFQDKNSITPEEELLSKDLCTLDLDLILKQHPYCLDSYAWAMLIVKLLYPKNKMNSRTSIIDEDDDEDFSLEDYLSNDPAKRPSIKQGLELNLFNLCKSLEKINTDDQFDPFKLQNLNDFEANYENLLNYVKNVAKMDAKNRKKILNENLIDFLLSPIMFFSARIRENILPCVLIPSELKDKYLINNFYMFKNWNVNKIVKLEESCQLEPLIDLDKYKAFVLPRILSLFTMRSLQIRLVLLEFFPFYIGLINDMDSLKFEILPELLIGLKDKNEDLVSLTFCCLSIMVKLLGKEIVVGKSNPKKKPTTYFTENIPKGIQYQDMMVSNSNSLDDVNEMLNTNKIFSDSMIALHDETESVKSYNKNNTTVNETEEEKSSDEWLNDWDTDDKSTNSNFLNKPQSSASLVSLAGSIRNPSLPIESSKQRQYGSYKINDSMGAEYDIKSISIKKSISKDPDQELIENFLNEMKPKIELNLNTAKTESSKENNVLNTENQWECDEEINLDEL